MTPINGRQKAAISPLLPAQLITLCSQDVLLGGQQMSGVPRGGEKGDAQQRQSADEQQPRGFVIE